MFTSVCIPADKRKVATVPALMLCALSLPSWLFLWFIRRPKLPTYEPHDPLRLPLLLPLRAPRRPTSS
jgi:hypothetical protein